MGTRGIFGLRVDQKDHLFYNHFDSYPTGLGIEFVTAIAKVLKTYGSIAAVAEKARAIVVVDESAVVSAEHKQRFGKKYWENVDTGLNNYAYFRKLQGDLALTLDVGVAMENNDFIKDSLFCEYGYVLNLDDTENPTIEVYLGFRSKPHTDGRYASAWTEEQKKEAEAKGREFYYPCALVETIPLSVITAKKFNADSWAKKLEKKFEKLGSDTEEETVA